MYLEKLPIINGKRVLNDDFVNDQMKKIAIEIGNENEDPDLSFILEGFCGDNLEDVDMSGLSPETLRRLKFDSNTRFPDMQIEGISISEFVENLINQGKSFSNLIEEDESQKNYSEFVRDEGKPYAAGYVSRALITVRRKKTEEELANDNRIAEENRKEFEAAENEEQAEQLENDEALRISEDALKRSVAFTEVMLVRTYKSFWTEWVSLCDSLEELENDLQEFFAFLTKRKEE